MAKNIEMRYYNGSSYEAVYPKTLGSNVIMDNGETIEEKITHVGVSSAFEVGDVLLTTRGRPNEDWQLCNGGEYDANGYTLGLTASLAGPWKGINLGKDTGSVNGGLSWHNSFKYNNNVYVYKTNTNGNNVFYIEFRYLDNDGLTTKTYTTAQKTSSQYIQGIGSIYYNNYIYTMVSGGTDGTLEVFRISVDSILNGIKNNTAVEIELKTTQKILKAEDSYGSSILFYHNKVYPISVNGNLYLFSGKDNVFSFCKWNGTQMNVLIEKFYCNSKNVLLNVWGFNNNIYLSFYQDTLNYPVQIIQNEKTWTGGQKFRLDGIPCKIAGKNDIMYYFVYEGGHMYKYTIQNTTFTQFGSQYDSFNVFTMDDEMYVFQNSQIKKVSSITVSGTQVTVSGEIVCEDAGNFPWCATGGSTNSYATCYYNAGTTYFSPQSKSAPYLPNIAIEDVEAYIKAR